MVHAFSGFTVAILLYEVGLVPVAVFEKLLLRCAVALSELLVALPILEKAEVVGRSASHWSLDLVLD